MVTTNDPRVVSFFNTVTGKTRDSSGRFIGNGKSMSGFLYVTSPPSPTVQVVLPTSLLEYANAGSGTMSGKRPVGIRAGKFDTPEQAANTVASIFDSLTNLTNFINSSRCDATLSNYIYNGPKQKTDERMANEVFFEKYTPNDAKALQQKFGRDMVIREFNLLTINEFELRYGMNC